MIDVQEVLREVPHFEAFCAVEKLHELVASLAADSRFEARVAGTSANGVPIHHVQFGKGSVKALVVAGPHAPELIGSLTVVSLLSLLRDGNRALCGADVEWHIVPCIDPDAAILNEGWSQKRFTHESFMRDFYVQAPRDQVDLSFPISYKNLRVDSQSKEARILQALLDEILPDFYFSLHNSFAGGAFYYLTRDIGPQYYAQIYRLLDQLRFPLLRKPIWSELSSPYSESIVESFSMRKYYDYLETMTAHPEELLKGCGVGSYEYLAHVKPDALTCVVEMGYVRHPSAESEKETGRNLRQFTLQLDADGKFLAVAMLEEWEKVEQDLDPASPFYRSLSEFFLPSRNRIQEGGIPLSRFPTADVLFNPKYDKVATEADCFNACMVDGGFMFILPSYQFVRLLRASRQTTAVKRATDRLEKILHDALAGLARHIDFDAFEVFDYDILAKVQLGSGLIALNSLLAGQERTR